MAHVTFESEEKRYCHSTFVQSTHRGDEATNIPNSQTLKEVSILSLVLRHGTLFGRFEITFGVELYGML